MISITLMVLFLALPPELAVSDNTSESQAMLSQAYTTGVYMYTASALIEMFAEPLYILCQKYLLVRARLGVETVAVIGRCLVTFGLVYSQT
jgi:hypothetical protein